MGYDTYNIVVDLPSRNPGLGFDEYATALRGIIEHSEPRFAVGIFGTWGSGKSTLMDAIRRGLDQSRVVPVEFSAWRYEKEEHLIIPLLDTVRGALMDWADKNAPKQVAAGVQDPRRDPIVGTATTIGKVMASLLAGFSFKVGLPGALEASFDANKALSRASESAAAGRAEAEGGGNRTRERADPYLHQSHYHAAFRALREAFREFASGTQGLRIAVFVDDLDRCLPSGALEVLESMKLFFDLEGFIFVVGLDRGIVERCIDAQYLVAARPDVAGGNGGGDAQDQAGGGAPARPPALAGGPLLKGADYIKKIFQVPFPLAPVRLEQVEDLIDAIAADANAAPAPQAPPALGLPQEQVEELRGRVRNHLAYLVRTATINPREVKRYINAYVIQMRIKPHLGATPAGKDAALALQTIAFRPDWEEVSEAIATYGREYTEALQSHLAGEGSALEDVDPDLAQPPQSFLAYVDAGAPGHSLLEVQNLDEYVYAGETTQSSLGIAYVEIVRLLRGAKAAVRRIGEEGTSSKDRAAAVTEAKEPLSLLREHMDSLRSYREVERALHELDGVEADLKKARSAVSVATGNRRPGSRTRKTPDRLEALVTGLMDRLQQIHASLRELRRRGGVG